MTDTEIVDFLSKNTVKITFDSPKGYKEIVSCPSGLPSLRAFVTERAGQCGSVTLEVHGPKSRAEIPDTRTNFGLDPVAKPSGVKEKKFDTSSYTKWPELTELVEQVDHHWGYLQMLTEYKARSFTSSCCCSGPDIKYAEDLYRHSVVDLVDAYSTLMKRRKNFNLQMQEAHRILSQDVVLVGDFEMEPAKNGLTEKIRGWFK